MLIVAQNRSVVSLFDLSAHLAYTLGYLAGGWVFDIVRPDKHELDHGVTSRRPLCRVKQAQYFPLSYGRLAQLEIHVLIAPCTTLNFQNIGDIVHGG
jgi:hypothetical protein